MFIIIPVGVDYQARRYPVVTFTFMGINVLVYLLAWAVFLGGGPEAEFGLVKTLGLIPAHLTLHGLITSMFTQVGLFHLLGNMVYLFLFGACVEDIVGRGWFIGFYLLGGLLAGFLHLLVALAGSSASLPLIGASGAVSACIGGFVLLLGKTKINFRYFGWFFLRAFSGDFWLPAWLVISFWFLQDLFAAFVTVAADSPGEGVAFVAHVGGFLAGLAMIGLFRATRRANLTAQVLHPRPAVRARPAVRVVSPEPATILLYANGNQTGPFTRQQMAETLAAGSVPPDALYWQEGLPEWRPISELSGDGV